MEHPWSNSFGGFDLDSVPIPSHAFRLTHLHGIRTLFLACGHTYHPTSTPPPLLFDRLFEGEPTPVFLFSFQLVNLSSRYFILHPKSLAYPLFFSGFFSDWNVFQVKIFVISLSLSFVFGIGALPPPYALSPSAFPTSASYFLAIHSDHNRSPALAFPCADCLNLSP